ncbi:MAG: DUF4062 domain-containing protein [Mogibacterium sp.]|nr:DUF4062 domain-containing protein [Mogibacterium sp.]
MDWKEVKIFVSSTFNDMHAERDYLVTEVFPELSEWCEARRIRLTDIDLRWGVTREDSESGNTVRACLNCIDECRPFFLCFLGQRRGWVPDLNADVGVDTLRQYRDLRRKLGIYSITEMEIEHATLAPMTRLLADGPHTPEKSKAMFFFRNDPFSGNVLTDDQKKIYTNAAAEDEAAEDRKLAGSKEWIRKEWEPYQYDCRWDPEQTVTELEPLGEVSKGGLTDFTVGGKPLRDIILSGLMEMIEQEYPENVPVKLADRFDEDALEQQLYTHTASFDFIGRGKELGEIIRHTENDSLGWAGGEGEALFITAPEGIGKTALLARACQILQARGHKVLMRSCGLTDLSMTMGDLFLSLGNEAGVFRATGRDPQLSTKMDSVFLKSLMDKGYDTLILDGLDHAAGRERISDLSRIPPGFHLIISSDDPEEWRNFKCCYRTMVLNGMITAQERSALIDQYLLRTLKKLDREQKNIIISAPGSVYPMYIRLVLNELKTYGSFADLPDKIAKFGDTPKAAFAEMIRTLIDEYGTTMTGNVIGMLVYARDGLSEEELMTGLRDLRAYTFLEQKEYQLRLRMFLRRIRPYLVRVNGRYDIQNKTFLEAAVEQFGELESECRHALVHIYEGNLQSAPDQVPNEWNDVHGSHELLFQLEMLGEWDGIRYALTNPGLFRNISPDEYRGGYRNGVFFKKKTEAFSGRGSLAADTPVGFSLDTATPQGRENYRVLAEIFLEKASDNIGVIGRLYPHPYAPKCAALRASEDQSEFYRFRDLFYEAVQFARAAFRYERTSLGSDVEELSEKEIAWTKFDNKTNAIHSFLDYLSHFGGDQTGLSYQIEDMADEALREYNEAVKLLKSFREKLAQ